MSFCLGTPKLGVPNDAPPNSSVYSCRNPSLGLTTKARGCKVVAQEGDQKSLHMLPGMHKMWGNEPSHSQVNSHVGSWSPKWIPESSKRNGRGQNSLPWRVIYIIEKILKCKCLKWACIVHLNIWNTSYGQKKGQESTTSLTLDH
jgi:hypothetical protein